MFGEHILLNFDGYELGRFRSACSLETKWDQIKHDVENSLVYTSKVQV